MENSQTGLIVKALGGFYYVETSSGVFECHAKGAFRRANISPMVGDHVRIELDPQQKGTVCEVFERKNEILRPPMANIDKLFVVTSICEPNPNTIVIDKFITMSENKKIEPIIVITKSDLMNTADFEQIYKNAGFTVISINNREDDFVAQVKELLRDSVCAFTGNTGVGKSSLLNALYPEFNVETASISQKLGRGKHTTRHVELYKLIDVNGYVADTPGFGSMDLMQYNIILKQDLQYCFREFAPYLGKCKYMDCSHTVEKGCAVLEALELGKIEKSRHISYKTLFADAKNIKEWEHK